MWQLIIGSFSLSIIHALIPNHWIPLVAISKAEKWSTRETMLATFVTAFFHLLSTILIGILVGIAGIKLSESYEEIFHIATPSVLIVLGLVFLIIGLSKHNHHHHSVDIKNKKSKTAIIISLAIGMFFSPCIELEAYYLQAATFGTKGIFAVSVIYLFITLSLIMGLVYLGLKGINHFKVDFLEHHSKTITGGVLILLGVIAFLVEHHH